MTDRAPRTFVLEWIAAVAAADVTTAAKAVALACANFADYSDGSNMRAGTATLGKMAGLGERRTRAMMAELREARLIAWDGVPTSPGRARCYSLTLPNGGSGLPVYNSQRRQPSAGVEGSTAATYDRNGGNNQHERRQRAAAHQGPTRARPFAAPSTASAAPSTVAVHDFTDDGNGTCLGCALPGRNRAHRERVTA